MTGRMEPAGGPVYIECLADSLIIQPFGIRLTTDDFVQPVVANNPLDSALVAVREYFLENKLNEAGQTPYPLLIVRPDGAEYYSVARHAIRSWDEEFGYELITADKQLDFGEPDQQLAKKMVKAIEAARKRQQAYVAERMMLGDSFAGDGNAASGTNGGPGLQASSQLGGFVGPDGEYAASQQPGPSGQNQPDEPTRGRLSNEGGGEVSASGIGKGPSSVASIAENKGSNWALPDRNDRAIGYRRPVVIQLTRDAMVINPNAQPINRRRIEFTGSPEQSMETLVNVIWKQIDAWGVAGVNSYWKPELVFRVAPGGEQRFRQVTAMMHNSGLEVRETNE